MEQGCNSSAYESAWFAPTESWAVRLGTINFLGGKKKHEMIPPGEYSQAAP